MKFILPMYILIKVLFVMFFSIALDLEKHSEQAYQNINTIFDNPVSKFQLIKKLTSDWNLTTTIIKHDSSTS